MDVYKISNVQTHHEKERDILFIIHLFFFFLILNLETQEMGVVKLR